MVVGIMETEHFEFVVFGKTEAHAETLMNKAFAEHLSHCGIEWEQDTAPAEWYGCRFVSGEVGCMFRDGADIEPPMESDPDPEAGYSEAWATHNERFSGD